jgi:hypothetical protein
MDTLGEDLVLLSLDPGSGRVRTAQKIGYGLMGSELVRLAAGGRVDVEDERLVVRSSAPTGDAGLDAALASIAESRRPLKAERWVGRPRRDIGASYLERLAASGQLRKERGLLTRWRIVDAQRVTDARARLDAIAVPDARLDLAQAAFGGLAHAIGLDAVLYPGRANRDIRKRFKQVAEGQWTAAAVRSASSSQMAAVDAASQAAVDAANQAATDAATQAATDAATQAAVHAATQAAVHASVSAAHHAASAGAHGGHGGH